MIYRRILFTLTLIAVGWFIAHNVRQISWHDFRFKPAYLVFSFIAVTAAYLVRFGAWTQLASIMELHAPPVRAGRAYFLSYLARYIPGKVGLALVRVETYGQYRPEQVVLATGMELVSALAAAFLLTLIGLLSAPAHFPPYLKWFAWGGIAILPLLLSPPLLRSITRILSRLTGRQSPSRIPPFGINLSLVLLYSLPGLVHGLGLFLLLNALNPVPAQYYITITGAYYAASLTGLLAFFAPGGLGVREGIIMLVLPLIVPREDAVVAAVVIRLITILAEISLAGIFQLLSGSKKR
ncbi:MAG: flippase-like domain-containing protein [Candidatus Krumholzibacteriota bacterium]|nr:flippase-like domain-containing protein [Candidatus Krumholzibacteriota bacterium]